MPVGLLRVQVPLEMWSRCSQQMGPWPPGETPGRQVPASGLKGLLGWIQTPESRLEFRVWRAAPQGDGDTAAPNQNRKVCLPGGGDFQPGFEAEQGGHAESQLLRSLFSQANRQLH